ASLSAAAVQGALQAEVLPNGRAGDRPYRRSAEPLPDDVTGVPTSDGDGRRLGRPARYAGAAARGDGGSPDPPPVGRRGDAAARAGQRLSVAAAFSELVLKCHPSDGTGG